jgi:hypothetical protein
MTIRFGRYLRAALAGSLLFGGALTAVMIGGAIPASAASVVQTITGVGDAPYFSISSDGTHVWVANGNDTVTELDASTGAVVQTIDGVNGPDGVSSDGTDVWVANEYDGTVSEIAIAGTPGFTITTSSLPACTTGVAYGSVALQEAGAGTSTSPYTTTLKWKKVTLPKGLTLSSAGVLSGTPSSKLVGGSSSITVQVTETVTTLNGRRKVKTTTTASATIPLTIIQPQPTVTSVHKTSGPSAGGTTVSIKGTDLQGASVVAFGSSDATTFTVNSAGTKITALTPEEAAGPVDVRVTDPGGTSPTSSADVFTFTS